MQGIYIRPEQHKAIRDNPDREWQARQIVKPQPSKYFNHVMMQKPHYQVGEVVYIKEAHYQHGHYEGRNFVPSLVHGVLYDTPIFTSIRPNQVSWHRRSPIFLKAEDARDFIRITGVRAERLWGITFDDFQKEGIELDGSWDGTFARYWDSINPKYPWGNNPFVRVYTFKQVERPADANTRPRGHAPGGEIDG